MPRSKKVLPTDLSLEEIKRLLVVKEKLAGLEEKKAKLEKELANVEAQMARIIGGKGPARKKARKKTVRKAAAKKAGRKAAKKTVKAAARKTRKKAAKAAPKKGAAKKKAVARKGKATLEDVVARLITANKKPLPFQEILGTIVKKKLVATRSKNFANVLRRTLSTSKKIKRVGRGIYDVA